MSTENTGLYALVEEAERLSALDGNKGREVRRFFERNFAFNTLSLDLNVAGTTLFDQALFLDVASRFIKMANEAAAIFDNCPALVEFKAGCFNRAEGTLSLNINLVNPLPSSMKERQMLLQHFAFAARRLVMLGVFVDEERMAKERQEFFSSAPLQHAEPHYILMFEKLVNADYSEMGTTPFRIIDLAALLEPAVQTNFSFMD